MPERVTLPIADIAEESSDVRTLSFAHPLAAEPGQFVMISDLKGDEKPFSLSDCSGGSFSITLRRVGPFTRRLFEARRGDLFSIRGAYGSSFFVQSGRVLLVGGGCAVPPLFFLCRRLLAAGAEPTVVNGARSAEALLFERRFQALPLRQVTALEDAAEPLTAVDAALRLLQDSRFDALYAAGPEMMLASLIGNCGALDYQLLVERYMKCGIGICGSCTLDPLGIRACVEGPVLPRATVEQLTEFGVYRRSPSGARIPVNAGRSCEQ